MQNYIVFKIDSEGGISYFCTNHQFCESLHVKNDVKFFRTSRMAAAVAKRHGAEYEEC